LGGDPLADQPDTDVDQAPVPPSLGPLNLSHSLALFDRATSLIPGGTQTISKRPTAYALGAYPVYAERANGSHVWDVDGNEYIDYVLGCGPIVLGYNHPRVTRAMADQLARGHLFGLLSPLEVAAAAAFVDTVPNVEMVRFFKGGAEANSAAVRIARAVTGRDKVASSGYHGWHDQWAVVDDRHRRGVPRDLARYTLPFAHGDIASLLDLFRQHPGEIAAVILEPMTVDGEDHEFLAAVRRLTTDTGALLIFDEVVTGFRVALGGAQERSGITCDLGVFAKALANGMPLAAVGGPREIMRLAEELFITLTYGDESLSLAASIATLEVMHSEPVHEYLWAIGQRLMQGLNAAARNTGVPLEAKGPAPMFRLTPDPAAIERSGVSTNAAWRFVLARMARRGVLWRPGGVMFVTNVHTEEDIDVTVARAHEAFGELRDALAAGDLQDKEQRCIESASSAARPTSRK
jgi:glutamate-1-semialdehyde aminotransferase